MRLYDHACVHLQVQRNVEQATLVENLQKRLSAREQDLHMLEELIQQRDQLLKGAAAVENVPSPSQAPTFLDTALSAEIDSYFQAPGEPSYVSGVSTPNRSNVDLSPVRARPDAALRRASQPDGLHVGIEAEINHPELRDILITPRGAELACSLHCSWVAFVFVFSQLCNADTLCFLHMAWTKSVRKPACIWRKHMM